MKIKIRKKIKSKIKIRSRMTCRRLRSESADVND